MPPEENREQQRLRLGTGLTELRTDVQEARNTKDIAESIEEERAKVVAKTPVNEEVRWILARRCECTLFNWIRIESPCRLVATGELSGAGGTCI